VVSGDGVRPRGVLASLPTSFLIDTREAGLADLDVVIQVCNEVIFAAYYIALSVISTHGSSHIFQI